MGLLGKSDAVSWCRGVEEGRGVQKVVMAHLASMAVIAGCTSVIIVHACVSSKSSGCDRGPVTGPGFAASPIRVPEYLCVGLRVMHLRVEVTGPCLSGAL